MVELFASLSYAFRVGRSAIQGIIQDRNQALWNVLQPKCMQIPATED